MGRSAGGCAGAPAGDRRRGQRVPGRRFTLDGTAGITDFPENAMAEQITYYAVTDELTSRDQPRTVFRRVENDEGQTDEIFSRDLRWESSTLLFAAERGDTMFDFIPVGAAEAERIVTRISALASPE
jgi:hypothetical protein